MLQPTFSFSEIDSVKSFYELGQSLGGKTINNIIQIPSENGKGLIRKIDFEPGLHMRSWHFCMQRNISLHRMPGTEGERTNSISIIYFLSPGSVTITSPNFRKEMKLQDAMNIVMVSSNSDIQFTIDSMQEVKALDITISGDWIKEQFPESDAASGSFLEKIKDGSHPAVLLDTGSTSEYRIVSDLHEHALNGTKGSLYLKAKTLALVSDFFSKSFSQHPQEILEGNVLHQEKMLMVEKLLEQHLEKDLPSIEAIARRAALSESTLKRHFKLMFGKSIYEYYLEKKMEHGKRLLMEKPLTVKEVAYRLGYEKTSNFIHMFKKFYTYSPGHLKKNIAF